MSGSHAQLVSFLRNGGLNEQHVGQFSTSHLEDIDRMTRFNGEIENHEFSAKKKQKRTSDELTVDSTTPRSQRVDQTPDFSKKENREENSDEQPDDSDYHFLSVGIESSGHEGGDKGKGKGVAPAASGADADAGAGYAKGKPAKGGKDEKGAWGDKDGDGMPNKIDKSPTNSLKK